MEVKGHLKNLSELSEKVAALGESIRQAERDMRTAWKDYIELRDLQDVKGRMKEVEEALKSLQEEMGHIEEEHCREAKQSS